MSLRVKSWRPEDLFSVREAADVLGVSQKTVYRWIRDGRLPSHRLGGQHFLERSEVNNLAIREGLRPMPDSADDGETDADVSLYDMLVRGGVFYRIGGTTKKEVLQNALNMPGGLLSFGLDGLSAFFCLPILLISPLAALYGCEYLAREKKPLGPILFFHNILTASMLLLMAARNGLLFLGATVYGIGYVAREPLAPRPDIEDGSLVKNEPESVFTGGILLRAADLHCRWNGRASLAMTYDDRLCHCEERSDDAISFRIVAERAACGTIVPPRENTGQ